MYFFVYVGYLNYLIFFLFLFGYLLVFFVDSFLGGVVVLIFKCFLFYF